tara:strand:- start:10130 stop:17314 length:7185 start_codon:yes stop_codon:yes gene_type:complete
MVMKDEYSVFDDPDLQVDEEEEVAPVASVAPVAPVVSEDDSYSVFDDPDLQVDFTPAGPPAEQSLVEDQQESYSVFNDPALQIEDPPVVEAQDRMAKVTEPFKPPVLENIFSEVPEIRVRKDSPDVQFAPPMVYSGDKIPKVQQGLTLFTPYAGVNAMYEEYAKKHESSEVTDERKNLDENNLAENIAATVFVDATSEVAGRRSYDKLAEAIDAPEGTRDYRSMWDSDSFSLDKDTAMGLGAKALTDREDYAEFAINRVMKNLFEANAPNSLLTKVQKNYEMLKDDFDGFTAEDVFLTGEGIRGRTARTYAQMGSLLLNTLLTPVSFATAAASGYTRNPGEPHKNHLYLQSATANDVAIFGLENNASRLQPAERIAGRSYQPPKKDRDMPLTRDAIKMSASDVFYMAQPKIKNPWQKGLKAHIKRKHKEIFKERIGLGLKRALMDAGEVARSEERVREEMPSVEEVYSFLKDYALYSYVDGADSMYGEFLEGYPPVKPPANGWALEEALADSGKAQTKELSEQMQRTGGNALLFPPTSAMGRSLKYHDDLPSYIDSVNKSRIKEIMKTGFLGEAAKENPKVALAVIDAVKIDPNRYSTVLSQFTRNMLKMLGPEETGKMAIMALAGAKKYLLPSMIPFAEVGGMVSWDAVDLGDSEYASNEDVIRFWEDNPGIASIFIPGVLKGTSMAVGGAIKGGIAAIKSTPTVASTLKRTDLTPAEKIIEVGKVVGGEYDVLETGQVRNVSIPEQTTVAKASANQAFPVTETPTSLRNKAQAARDKGQAIQGDENATKSWNQVADGLEAAAVIAEDMLMEKQKQAEASDRTFAIKEKVTPTLDKVDPPVKTPFEYAKAQSTARGKKEAELKSILDAEDKVIEKNKANKTFRSSGQNALNRLLREMAIEAGYSKEVTNKKGKKVVRVNLKRFKAENVKGKEEAMAARLSQNGVTDPRVYRALLPKETPAKGPTSSISSYVFSAEKSKHGELKRAYDAEMQKVADLRGVPVEKVKAEVNKLSVVEDMIKNGVVDEGVYALFGLDDVQVKEAIKRAKTEPQSPYVRVKTRGEELPFEGSINASKEHTFGDYVLDIPYGATRVALGRKPANIISNRLNSVKGKPAIQKVLPFAEASILATLEFMKEPFAFTNFPSWIGDFVSYVYLNSTNNNAFMGHIGSFFQQLMSPSSILGDELSADVVWSQGRIEVAEAQMRALAKRLGKDEDATKAGIDIDKSLKEVGLDQHSAGESVIRIVPRDTLSGRFKNAVATAFFGGEGAYVDVPSNSPSGTSRLFIKEIFDIEYQTSDGKWIKAGEATDVISAQKQIIKTAKARRDEINKELSSSAEESLARTQSFESDVVASTMEAQGLTPPRRVPGGDPYTGGLTGDPAPSGAARVAALTQEKKTLSKTIQDATQTIKDTKEKFGSAEDVFQVVDGKVTGVRDIRINFKDEIIGVVGDAEKAVLGVLNAYTVPMQNKIMSLGANLAAGAKGFALGVESGRVKNVVKIQGIAGAPEIVKIFKDADPNIAESKAAAYAKRVNEEYQAKGNKGVIASTTADAGKAKQVVTGKRDLNVDGYNAVEKTAGYMSAYFSEAAVADHMYSLFKKIENGELTFDQMLQQDAMSARLIIAAFPDDVVKGVTRKGMSEIDIATRILDQVEKGKIKAPSAAGTGRHYKERLWTKDKDGGLPFGEIKDFYSLYSESAMTTYSGLFKRVEHYRLLNNLRESGLILSDREITNTPGVSLKGNRFESMSRLAKEYPGLVEDIKGLYIEKTVAEGLVHQKNILDAVLSTAVESFSPANMDVGGLFVKANRQLKRLAVISIANGTMLRNFISGVAVQARMAEIPADMRYFRQARKALQAIKRGDLENVDPLFVRLLERQGGGSRAVRDMEMRRENRGEHRNDQLDYIESVLSGDNDAPPLGVALTSAVSSTTKTAAEGLTRALDGSRTSSQTYGVAVGQSRVTGQERYGVDAAVEPIGKVTLDALGELSDTGVAVYGDIDATLRLAYSYELVKSKKIPEADASLRARHVFYDHPDIPPVFAKLRDLPYFGFPFAGHMIWSTKAFGNYMQRNPLRALVDGVLLRATTAATEAALNLASLYDSDIFETDEDFGEFRGLPMIAADRSTLSERKSLKRGDSPPREESKFVMGQVGVKEELYRMGTQSDTTFDKARREFKKTDTPWWKAPGLALAAAEQMLGSTAGKWTEGLTKPTPEEDRITQRLTEATKEKDGGAFYGDIFETVLTPLTFVSADARGAAKAYSAEVGYPFAGQDASVTTAYSNLFGLAMKIKDLRAYKQNFNEVGQDKLKGLTDALKVYGLTGKKPASQKEKLIESVRRKRLIKAVERIERADNIFKRNRAADGERMRNSIVILMKGMLKNKPQTREFAVEYENLLEYFKVEGF